MSEYPTITGDFREFRGETNVNGQANGRGCREIR